MSRGASRASDARILRWLALRSAGDVIASIAAAEGMTNDGYIAQATTRVRDADVEESTTLRPGGDASSLEDAETVLSAYQWRQKTGAKT